MSVSASTVWEIRSTATASNVNGGGFVTGASGVNKSEQDSAEWAITTATSAGAGNVLLHASAHADMVGNIARTISGTNLTVTSPWFEITAVTPGVDITFSTNIAGASIATGVVSNGTLNIGGALSLGSSDDAVFENTVVGNKWWIKNGTYTLNGTVSIGVVGTTTKIEIEGYATTRGDKPVGSTRPIFNTGAVVFTFPTAWAIKHMQFTGTGTTVVVTGSANQISYSKFTNTTTTADRVALNVNTDSVAFACEAICYRGRAFQVGADASVIGCYAHDSDIGFVNVATANSVEMIGNLSESNVSAAIRFTGALTAPALIFGNTLYGGAGKTGTGILMSGASTDTRIVNNIISGFVTGVNHATAGQTIGYDDFNAYYNNTTDATNWTKGANCTTTDPTFTSVSQLTGSAGVVASSVLTVASATGIVAGQDFVYIISGTGATAGQYPITAVNGLELTLGIAPGGSGTNIVYQITTGRNFAVGTTMKALGFPSAMPAGLTTSYADIGAIQRQESSTSGGSTKGGFGRFGG